MRGYKFDPPRDILETLHRDEQIRNWAYLGEWRYYVWNLYRLSKHITSGLDRPVDDRDESLKTPHRRSPESFLIPYSILDPSPSPFQESGKKPGNYLASYAVISIFSS